LNKNNEVVLHFTPFKELMMFMVDEKQNNIQDDVGDISVVLDSIKILS